MIDMTEQILQLVMAVVVGGLIGAERQYRHGLGLRTMMLVCLGATLFTIYSDFFAVDQGDPRRIAAAVVTGVGFLGAGMILRHQGGIIGLTTAASVWLTAALGMGIGMGQYLLAISGTVLVLIILWAIPRLKIMDNSRDTFMYEATCNLDEKRFWELTEEFTSNNLTISRQTLTKKGQSMICSWRVSGASQNHQRLMQSFLKDPEVKEFDVR